MSIKSWWNRVLRLTNESQFGNLRTSYEQPKFLQLDHISAASKTQIKQTKNSMAAICIFIGAMETNISGRLVSYSSLFLHSLHLHRLLPTLLHKTGSKQHRAFMITGPRYVNLIPFKVPFNCDHCSLQFRLKGTTTRKHNLNLKCIKVCSNFC